MKVDLAVALSGLHQLDGAGPTVSLDVARAAESAGARHVVIGDHVVGTEDPAGYPWPGDFALPADEPWPEPLIELAVIAGATSRIGLLTGVLLAPLRPAVWLAKAAATLDARCGGRLQLGVGAGWMREEFDACGVPYDDRDARLDDTVRACQVLWSDRPASFSSGTVTFDRIWSLPAPAGGRGIPVWFGGGANRRTARRVAVMGVGWMCGGGALRSDAPDAYIRQGVRYLHEAFLARGRDPQDLEVMATVRPRGGADGRADLEASLGEATSWTRAGVTTLSLAPGTYVDHIEEVPGLLDHAMAIVRGL